ncbi:MAG: TolC family protein [Candidatus Eisenbacteria bacterium]|uniref:TolC family protein n=1 Tax=Eiseniibacteriota bacterium TaxID=2212470 RepID=A0A9D6LAG0_UNCEI|nr:TolC family protein [Candidatus Eisenbacteria bacterium]MBI3539598.1 TolC family protein [Candidatus Eisenbacteria bacterium]
MIAALATLPLRAAIAAPASVDAEPDTSYRAGEPATPILALTLDQARKLAVANSPAAHAALAAVRSARGAWMKEAGTFDPVLSGADEQVSTDTPSSSPFAGTEIRQRSLNGGLAWRSPIGTTLNFTVARVRYQSNAPFSTLPVQRTMAARAEFVQPLFRGFGLAATRGDLRAADRDLESAREQLATATLDLDANVEDAYWDLYAAERQLEVQRLQRQRAAVFLRDQLLRGRAGVVGPGAVAIARTFLAQQDAALIDARLAAGTAADHLSEVVGGHPEGEARYHALDEPPAPGEIEPLATLLKRAMNANPSLLAARADSAAARNRYARASANDWPSVDAFGGYGTSGLSGTGRQIVFGTDTVGTDFDTGFSSAWSQVTGRDFPDWHFGIRVTVPLGWRTDRGERERQRGFYDRARETLRARQLALESAVRAGWREAGEGRHELDATLALVAAAEEQARIARLEYQAGRATAYDLVNLEAELAAARFREAAVRVRVAHSATELRRLTTPVPGRTR